jgi:hypothetical protein
VLRVAFGKLFADPSEQLAAGGYQAVLIFNRTASDACNQTLGMSVEGDIPTFGVAPRQKGYAIFGKEAQDDDAACLAGDGSQLSPMTVGETGDTLTFSSYVDGWGFVHLYRNGAGKMAELDTYALPQAHLPAFGHGRAGLLSPLRPSRLSAFPRRRSSARRRRAGTPPGRSAEPGRC